MKIHDRLPDGFRFADRLQEESYEASGSINGARKVALVKGPDGRTDVACCLRPPRSLDDILSIGRDAVGSVEKYISDYNAGWAAAGRSGDSKLWDSGDSAHSWDDGYLDRAAGRMKWHLTYCVDHDACGEG